jgi:hypothetical protein
MATVQDSNQESGFGWGVFEKGFGQDDQVKKAKVKRKKGWTGQQ